MASSILLKRQNAIAKLLRPPPILAVQSRSMGGGPRTFPGGLNKWQWKRMHEKRAREKERTLLDQEKQLYQARIRSQIRAGHAGNPDPFSDYASLGPSPMSPRDHVKALADRFVKHGAEDLWNSDDGPIESETPAPPSDQRQRSVPRHSEALNSNLNRNSVFTARNYSSLSAMMQNRTYSSFSMPFRTSFKGEGLNLDWNSVFTAWNYSSLSVMIQNRTYSSSSKPFRRSFVKDEDRSSKLDWKSSGDSERRRVSPRGNGRKFYPSKCSDEDSDDDSDEEVFGSAGSDVRRRGSREALGKFDVNIERRKLSVKEYKGDLSDQIEVIKYEINQKKRLLEGEAKDDADDQGSFISPRRFDEFQISPLTVKALSLAGYDQMTRVQEAALSVAMDGKDALVKAKTGTGKTGAYLVPAIETVLKAMNSKSGHRGVDPIFVLVLCPTRELASQVAAEANALLRFHNGIGAQTLVGGTRFKDERQHLESGPSQIIAATPGRLMDHIENKSGISSRLMCSKMLILDEARSLLDMGFRLDIEKIVDCLPRQRQTLLFSATVPKEVHRISQLILKKEHEYIDTTGLGNVETVSKVRQSYLVAPHEYHFQIVHRLLKDHILLSPDYKVIVFCPTAMITTLVYELLNEMKMNVKEIHSKKPQIYRSRVSEEFRISKERILVTSDVSAHGMNYPNVTLVVQVGIPVSREQYIHRLGRTGREGKGGEGILLIAPWEKYFLEDLKDLPLEEFTLGRLDLDEKFKVDKCMEKIDESIKQAAYHSWLGYYNSIKEIGRDKTALVESANVFCESIGLETPPGLARRTAVKMGLRHVPGIRINKLQS